MDADWTIPVAADKSEGNSDFYLRMGSKRRQTAD
jgi:hypothetical protein